MNEQCLFRFACGVVLLAAPSLANAQMAQNVANPQPAPAAPQGFLTNYGKATSIFPRFWRPYEQKPIPLPVLENSRGSAISFTTANWNSPWPTR